VTSGQAVVETLTARAYTIPTDAPEADGTIAWTSTTMVVVEARAEGHVGLGWTYAPAATAALIDELLRAEVIGQDALAPSAATDRMIKAVRNAGRPGVASCGISALDIALWDLAARLLEQPLHVLLGPLRDAVPVYGSGGFTTYDETRLSEQLAHWVHAQGIPRVKIKIGESWGSRVPRDLERIRQARTVIGEDASLFVDANGAYTDKQAIRVAERFADQDVTWFEEPVSSDDLDGLRRIRDRVSPDVAAGEYGYDLPYFQRMCDARAVDCLQADATRCGGITEWRRAAALAAAQNLEISGHCAPNLHAAVASSVPNLRHLEWFHDHVRIESLCFAGTLDPAGGTIRPRAVPGHGFELRDTDVERYRVR
jgi:L-alanine-DL-glutamate epimerase-like enolase superfamily enzyme